MALFSGRAAAGTRFPAAGHDHGVDGRVSSASSGRCIMLAEASLKRVGAARSGRRTGSGGLSCAPKLLVLCADHSIALAGHPRALPVCRGVHFPLETFLVALYSLYNMELYGIIQRNSSKCL